MPRYDYEKLMSISEQIEDKEWRIISIRIDSRFLCAWMKFSNTRTALFPKRFNGASTYSVQLIFYTQ